jgi:type II secretory pathway pseudopilin PulG
MRGNKKESGLTLTEILVTIAIIIILSGLVIANSGAGQGQLALSRSANKLAQDIRRAQEMAMSATICEPCGNVVPPYYGIEFDKNNNDSYFIFADLNGSFKYESLPSPDKKIETITLEKGITIGELLTTAPSNNPDRVWIGFLSPDPLTSIKGPGDWRSTAEITLEGGGQNKKVIVNQAGLIYVE